MAYILLWSSAVRVHDSQSYWKMDVTKEHISRILELRKILLSIQIKIKIDKYATNQTRIFVTTISNNKLGLLLDDQYLSRRWYSCLSPDVILCG